MTAVLEPAVDIRRWLPFVPPQDTAPFTLYCLPHAGGSASAYRSWSGRLGAVSVRPMQPPGRETRLADPPHHRMGPLVEELADVILADAAGPYGIYGHSLGALVGYEVVREIRRRGGPDPEHLIVSGAPAPHLSTGCGTGNGAVAEMSDGEVADMLRQLGGTPELFLSDPTVLQMILPRVRADFGVKDTYEYEFDAPLTIPITAIASTADPRARIPEMQAWRDHTVAPFRFHTLSGGHFAVLEQPATTHRYLNQALAA